MGGRTPEAGRPYLKNPKHFVTDSREDSGIVWSDLLCSEVPIVSEVAWESVSTYPPHPTPNSEHRSLWRRAPVHTLPTRLQARGGAGLGPVRARRC